MANDQHGRDAVEAVIDLTFLAFMAWSIGRALRKP